MQQFDNNFYQGKKVLVTGHTGFKGTWMCKMLVRLGAQVTGYSLEPPTNPSLFQLSGIEKEIDSVIGDIRDLEHLKKVLLSKKPEIVIHLAAQPIVIESYSNPVYTYETNVMGTVNILEAIRCCESVQSFVNVTTDKVYLNKEWDWGYRENEELNGFDPYSNSKSCSELVTSSYRKSFFGGDKAVDGNGRRIAISTCRAGNVIGGGDFAADRIIPDCIRDTLGGRTICVRNPNSTRPYQHVLEPVFAYLLLAQMQSNDYTVAGNYNVGPEERDCRTTGELVGVFCKKWNSLASNSQKITQRANWSAVNVDGPHEANFLKLDCSKIKNVLGWRPCWDVETAVEKVVEWTAVYATDGDVSQCMEEQIADFLEDSGVA